MHTNNLQAGRHAQLTMSPTTGKKLSDGAELADLWASFERVGYYRGHSSLNSQ